MMVSSCGGIPGGVPGTGGLIFLLVFVEDTFPIRRVIVEPSLRVTKRVRSGLAKPALARSCVTNFSAHRSGIAPRNASRALGSRLSLPTGFASCQSSALFTRLKEVCLPSMSKLTDTDLARSFSFFWEEEREPSLEVATNLSPWNSLRC